MSKGILSAGLRIGYAVGETAPTTGYTWLKEVKSIPQASSEPSTHQVTDLDELERHVTIGGLLGEVGTLGLTMNLEDGVVTAWEALLTAYEGLSGESKLWFTIEHPKITKANFFTGRPYPLPTYGGDVDAPLETTGTIAVESEITVADKATD